MKDLSVRVLTTAFATAVFMISAGAMAASDMPSQGHSTHTHQVHDNTCPYPAPHDPGVGD